MNDVKLLTEWCHLLEKDYNFQIGSQYARRLINKDNISNSEQYQLTMSLSDQEAKNIAEVKLWNTHIEKTSFSFKK